MSPTETKPVAAETEFLQGVGRRGWWESAGGGSGHPVRRRGGGWAGPLGEVEGLDEEGRHLPPRVDRIRTVVVVAAAGGDLFVRELLDPAREGTGRRNVVEHSGRCRG